LFTQQNQRVKNDWPNCFASAPLYSRICIGSPQRGQGSPSPGMTTDFLHFRFPVNVCAPPRYFRPQKTRTPARRERSRELALSKSELELWRHVTIGWHVAVDFKTDADFNQNGCRPSHSAFSFGPRENSRAETISNRKCQMTAPRAVLCREETQMPTRRLPPPRSVEEQLAFPRLSGLGTIPSDG
jgi:hypothetical protein